MLCYWQLLKGTHRCGRIEHNLLHGQTVADSERIQQLSKQFEHLYADLQPGEKVLFFTAPHGMQTRSSDENSVCLSVCHMREL